MTPLTPPAALRAPGDLRIRGAPLAAYFHLLLSGALDFVSFTELKSIVVANGIHVDERTARWVLRRLVACGYLDEEARERPTAPGRYRLSWSGRPLPNSLRATVAPTLEAM